MDIGAAWETLVASATSPDDDTVDPVVAPAELARWAAVEASFADRPVTDLAQAWVEQELRVVEAAEAVKAWADARTLAALRRLHEAVGMVVQEQADLVSMYGNDMVSFAAVADETTTAAVDEVALATGLSEGQVAARLSLATNREERATPLLAALAAGEVSLDRALRIHQATDGLDPDVARAVADRLLARMADGSVRSHRSFGRELRRQVVLHTPDPADARADAVSRRTSYGWLEADGTGRLTVTGEAGRVTAALDRVDGLARGLRSGGDARTLEQLRSDLALDLLLYGWADPQQVPEPSASTFVGQPPPARVSLVVSLTTVLGLDDQPGEIPGHGFVPAAVARSIAGAAGSVWRRLVTDPLDGTALELSTTRYRPTRRDGRAGRRPRPDVPGAGVHRSRRPLRPRPRGALAPRTDHRPQPPAPAPPTPQPQDPRHLDHPAGARRRHAMDHGERPRLPHAPTLLRRPAQPSGHRRRPTRARERSPASVLTARSGGGSGRQER